MSTMATIYLQVDSFVTKFKSLISVGCEASLNFKTENGKISATINADFLMPSADDCYSNSSSPRSSNCCRRGPAYFRRQIRRQNGIHKTKDNASSSPSAETKVEAKDNSIIAEFKSTVQKDCSSQQNSDLVKESFKSNVVKNMLSVSIEESSSSQNKAITTSSPTKTSEQAAPSYDNPEQTIAADNSIEFGEVSQILKTLSDESTQERPSCFDSCGSNSNLDSFQHPTQPVLEEKREINKIECTLGELTRQELPSSAQ